MQFLKTPPADMRLPINLSFFYVFLLDIKFTKQFKTFLGETKMLIFSLDNMFDWLLVDFNWEVVVKVLIN